MAIDWANHATATGIALVVAVGAASSAPWWWPRHHPVSADAGVVRFEGGCAAYNVYSQNRYHPYGTAVRSAPDPTAKQIASRDPNQTIAVDGWINGPTTSQTNTPPFNKGIWFHLSDGAGWVSFAGVRGAPTEPDPVDGDYATNGGTSAPTPADCQGSAQ